MIVNVDDRKRIKKVNFLYPELVNDHAEQYVTSMYEDILKTEDELYQARVLVRHLEDLLKEKKKALSNISSIFTLEFEQKEIEQVDKVDTNMAIINPTDASNKNYTGQ